MPAEPYVPVVVGREVKHTIFPSPQGPMHGYQLRFQLGAAEPDGTVVESWTPWLHLPNPLMLYLVESLDDFMRKEGHLATVTTDGGVPAPSDAAPAGR